MYDNTQSERRSEQEKRVRAEREIEHLRERLKNTENRMAKLKAEPKKRWSLF